MLLFFVLGDVSFILRHDIEVLEFKGLYVEEYNNYLIDKSNVGQASIEHLIIRIENTEFTADLFNLIFNYCNHLPKLKKVDLIIEANYMVSYIINVLKIYLFLG
jgi:hypothetical protein